MLALLRVLLLVLIVVTVVVIVVRELETLALAHGGVGGIAVLRPARAWLRDKRDALV